jgi:hypothetical protein
MRHWQHLAWSSVFATRRRATLQFCRCKTVDRRSIGPVRWFLSLASTVGFENIDRVRFHA